jgi:hypothetical protein
MIYQQWLLITLIFNLFQITLLLHNSQNTIFSKMLIKTRKKQPLFCKQPVEILLSFCDFSTG